MGDDSHKKERKPLPIVTECVLCAELPPKLLEKIERAWLREKTAKQIGKHYNIPHELVEIHIRRCLYNKHRSRFQRVSTSFDNLWEALDVAHEHYMKSPSTFTAQAYQGFVNQLRGLLADLEKIQNAPEVAAEIVRVAVNPLIRKLTDAIILESSALKEDISIKFGELESEKMIKSYVKRVGIVFGEAVKDTQSQIESVLSAKDKNRQQQKKQATQHESEDRSLRLIKGAKA